MAKAIAISLKSPLGLAFLSLGNLFSAVADFMYGSRERTRYTLAFAFALIILSSVLSVASAGSLGCSHDTLAGAF